MSHGVRFLFKDQNIDNVKNRQNHANDKNANLPGLHNENGNKCRRRCERLRGKILLEIGRRHDPGPILCQKSDIKREGAQCFIAASVR